MENSPPVAAAGSQPPSSAESIGTILRNAREAQGIPIERAAHHLKMPLQQVLALEQDNFSRLPGASYVRFLTRHYAKYLNLAPSFLEEYLPKTQNIVSKGPRTTPSLASQSVTGSGVVYSSGEDREDSTPSSLPLHVLPAILTSCIVLGFLVSLVYFYFERKSNREDEKFLASPAAQAIQEEVSTGESPVVHLKTIHTFDSALLERAPYLSKMNPPLLKFSKSADGAQQKAKLFQSALKMSFIPALPQLSPQTVITPPRNKKRTTE